MAVASWDHGSVIIAARGLRRRLAWRDSAAGIGPGLIKMTPEKESMNQGQQGGSGEQASERRAFVGMLDGSALGFVLRPSLGVRGTAVAGIIAAILLGCASGSSRMLTTSAPAPQCAGNPSADQAIIPARLVTSKAVLRSRPATRLPEGVLGVGETATIRVSILVGPDGVPDSTGMRVVSGHDERLDSLAVRIMKRARFWPACLGDDAVRFRAVQPITFVAPKCVIRGVRRVPAPQGLPVGSIPILEMVGECPDR